MNLLELHNEVPAELAAVEFFERIRWNLKPICPYCESNKSGERHKDFRFNCKNCKKSYSVTTGTHLHNTRLELKTWLYAISIITDAKKGVSALQLQRNLGVSYPTAHSMYMRLRDLMKADKKQLSEIVEMDETFIGGKPRKMANPDCLTPIKRADLDARIKELKQDGIKFSKGSRKVACAVDVKRGRGTKKIPVVGIVERNGDVVAEAMKTLSSDNLTSMVKKHVDTKESVIVTDSFKGYNKLHKIIQHVKIDHQEMYSYKGVNTNTIESFWATIERGIIGQYHKVSPKYLPKYIQEFVFKWNNRNEDKMFETLVQKAMLPNNQ
jgi:transposase-like protein